VEREGLGWAAAGGRGPGRARAVRWLGWVTGVAALLAGGAGVLGGCSSSAPGGQGVGATCGTTRTAADVPVIIKVFKGTVDCGLAMRVENEYAAKIRAGQVPGNGGGAPVTVNGWTCQGYPTPEVLSTGTASQCHTASAAIVAVLPVPAPGATSTAG
jgi:hypothetical protein